MNDKSQQRKIRSFLRGNNGNQDIDAFCLYQWLERCHFQGWWGLGISLGSQIPATALDQEYRKRVDFLLAECRRNYTDEQNQDFGTIGDKKGPRPYMNKAILIPANPNRDFNLGQDLGSIDAHVDKLRREGAVFWTLLAPGNWVASEFPHSDVGKGYLYDVSKKMVTHVCDIAWIKPMLELSFQESGRFFLEKFENPEQFNEIAEAFYVFNITDIRPIDRPRSIHEFKKTSDGQPVKLVRNYCIIEDVGGGSSPK